MSNRSVYLAKYRLNANQRAHFAIFIPNATSDQANLSQNFRKSSCKGTIIHVVGEPIMSGYALEFKRNYECSSSRDLQALVFLGYVLAAHVCNPANPQYVKESTPRSLLEREAATIPPPPRGQDIRAPIDGVGTDVRENLNVSDAATDPHEKVPGVDNGVSSAARQQGSYQLAGCRNRSTRA
nr:hypothetical protein CFP56_38968 [Quercus suber]